jgi:cytochrome c oxidase cbb3-type subunit 3
VILALIGLLPGALGSQICKAQNPADSAATRSRGKLFETTCAVCHGLDGRGGEHAPNIARGSTTRLQTDGALFEIINSGIPERGMPAFSALGSEQIRTIVSELRLLQNKASSRPAHGNPEKGKELFFGKGRCADCHAIDGQGRFLSTDLSDFAAEHDADEIRESIVNPQSLDAPPSTFILAVTKQGARLTGLLRNENNTSLQVQDREGRFFLMMKSSLQSIERTRAPAMPNTYRQEMSATEIEDLVSFVARQTSSSAVVEPLAGSREKARSSQ